MWHFAPQMCQHEAAARHVQTSLHVLRGLAGTHTAIKDKTYESASKQEVVSAASPSPKPKERKPGYRGRSRTFNFLDDTDTDTDTASSEGTADEDDKDDDSDEEHEACGNISLASMRRSPSPRERRIASLKNKGTNGKTGNSDSDGDSDGDSEAVFQPITSAEERLLIELSSVDAPTEKVTTMVKPVAAVRIGLCRVLQPATARNGPEHTTRQFKTLQADDIVDVVQTCDMQAGEGGWSRPTQRCRFRVTKTLFGWVSAHAADGSTILVNVSAPEPEPEPEQEEPGSQPQLEPELVSKPTLAKPELVEKVASELEPEPELELEPEPELEAEPEPEPELEPELEPEAPGGKAVPEPKPEPEPEPELEAKPVARNDNASPLPPPLPPPPPPCPSLGLIPAQVEPKEDEESGSSMDRLMEEIRIKGEKREKDRAHQLAVEQALRERETQELALVNREFPFLVYHVVGASGPSISLQRMLHRICVELIAASPLMQNEEIGSNEVKNLQNRWLELAEMLAMKTGRLVLIVLDAVNELKSSDGAWSMKWMPRNIPRGVRLIVSMEAHAHECLIAIRKRLGRGALRELEVPQLSREDLRAVVIGNLSRFHKSLSEDMDNELLGNQMQILLDMEQAGSPLFLVAACEQLRVFGVYEKVTHYLTHELPGTVRSLFRHLLSTLEKENGEELVEFILSAITISSGGLLATEINGMVERRVQLKTWKHPVESSFSRLRSALGFFLSSGGAGLLKFFSYQLSLECQSRYRLQGLTRKVKALRGEIADYFVERSATSDQGRKERSVSEGFYQFLQSHEWTKAINILKILPGYTISAQIGEYIGDMTVGAEGLIKAAEAEFGKEILFQKFMPLVLSRAGLHQDLYQRLNAEDDAPEKGADKFSILSLFMMPLIKKRFGWARARARAKTLAQQLKDVTEVNAVEPEGEDTNAGRVQEAAEDAEGHSPKADKATRERAAPAAEAAEDAVAFEGTDEEVAAASKIQAVSRGKATRREMASEEKADASVLGHFVLTNFAGVCTFVHERFGTAIDEYYVGK